MCDEQRKNNILSNHVKYPGTRIQGLCWPIQGNYRSRIFTYKDQFLVMSYAQLTNRGSLRDIENCLTALSSRLYHCGISYAVPCNTLAKANEKRDWRIYADFAQVLVKKVRPLYITYEKLFIISSNGSSNTCTSNPSMEHLRMLSISRFGLPFVHTFYWL